jgi:hypothetical protein
LGTVNVTGGAGVVVVVADWVLAFVVVGVVVVGGVAVVVAVLAAATLPFPPGVDVVEVGDDVAGLGMGLNGTTGLNSEKPLS